MTAVQWAATMADSREVPLAGYLVAPKAVSTVDRTVCLKAEHWVALKAGLTAVQWAALPVTFFFSGD